MIEAGCGCSELILEDAVDAVCRWSMTIAANTRGAGFRPHAHGRGKLQLENF